MSSLVYILALMGFVLGLCFVVVWLDTLMTRKGGSQKPKQPNPGPRE
jgi:hypothetical protein